MSVLRFRYLGKRQYAGSGHKMSLCVAQIPGRNSVTTGKAMTLPARMQPPDFGSGQPFVDEPGSPVSTKGSEYREM